MKTDRCDALNPNGLTEVGSRPGVTKSVYSTVVVYSQKKKEGTGFVTGYREVLLFRDHTSSTSPRLLLPILG
jgi:hypothetical protein